MPARLMSFPFRFGPDGSVATIEQGSDDEVDMLIAVALLTSPGERVTVPTFGVADATFSGFEQAGLQRHCNDFGPDVVITRASPVRRGDDREELTIAWSRPGGNR